jgi:hypothetical protein
MRARVDLTLQPSERTALRALEPEEREAVIDELLVQVREDLEWVMARATVEEEPRATPPLHAVPPPMLRVLPPPRRPR